MGNTGSRVVNYLNNKQSSCVSCSYYPKNKFLQPCFLTQVGLLGYVGFQATVKEAVKETVQSNFRYHLILSGLAGMQAYTTFVSGPTLLFSFSRQETTKVEEKLFPKYAYLATILSGLSAVLYLQRHPFSSWTPKNSTFGWIVLGSFAVNFFTSTCFGEQTFKLLKKLLEIEKKAGVDENTIAFIGKNEVLDKDPVYKKLNCRFQLMHSLTALASLISFGDSIAQIYLLAHNNSLTF